MLTSSAAGLDAGRAEADWLDKDWATKSRWIDELSPSTVGHTALDVAGMLPVVGALFDGANAAWYLYEGGGVAQTSLWMSG